VRVNRTRTAKPGSSTRYGWLVWNQDEQTAQIIQQSATFFKNLAVLAQDEEYGDPTGYDIKIKRVGQGLETTYTITPSANREPLGESAKKELAAIDLIEKLKASPYAQHVMWLAEADNPKKAAEPEEKKKDTVIDEHRRRTYQLRRHPILTSWPSNA
jgi:hypothetical protein